jgi:hypothetical protein
MISAADAPSGVVGLSVAITGAIVGDAFCDTGPIAVCHVLGSFGQYQLSVSAPGYQAVQLQVTVPESRLACNVCGAGDRQDLTVVLHRWLLSRHEAAYPRSLAAISECWTWRIALDTVMTRLAGLPLSGAVRWTFVWPAALIVAAIVAFVILRGRGEWAIGWTFEANGPYPVWLAAALVLCTVLLGPPVIFLILWKIARRWEACRYRVNEPAVRIELSR